MKQLLILCFFLPGAIYAQDKKPDCQDIVFVKGGSKFRGKILDYQHDGDLVMETWSGAKMRLPAANIVRIVQKCKGNNDDAYKPVYSFKERGWYNSSRLSILSGASGIGFSVQHSTGMQYNRFVGFGLGLGLEQFDPWEIGGAATVPIFAEIRGYLLPQRITPFYDIGLGYGVSNKKTGDSDFDWVTEQWRGGWMAQGHIGYRIGNHFFVQLGIRFQHKTRSWSYPRSTTSGVDQILHKRLDIGIGLLL
jgi:hypothetical protein